MPVDRSEPGCADRPEPPRPLRVVLAEDEALLREGLQLLLTRAGMDVVAAAGTADDLLTATAQTRPDVVITDIRMPPDQTDDGLRAAIRIRAAHPRIGVIVLSQHVDRHYAMELIAGNARGVGYLLKQRIADVDRFCADVRQVAAGGTALDAEVVEIMLHRARRTRPDLSQLTARQHDVLVLIAQGRSNAAIAAVLHISDKAVVQHISRVYDRLGLPTSSHDHRRVLAAIQYLTN